MARTVREETVRSLLVAKHLLAANSGQLTPNSDAVAVARTILASHDAADLAAAAIASECNVPGLSERTYLTDYPRKIESHTGIPFPGGDFVKQVNAARVAFKHHGTLPDPRQWYTVIDRTWDWIDNWCQSYLGLSIADINLEHLLTDLEVKKHYNAANEHHIARRYSDAIAELASALYHQLRQTLPRNVVAGRR